jgi:hypothetical protein
MDRTLSLRRAAYVVLELALLAGVIMPIAVSGGSAQRLYCGRSGTPRRREVGHAKHGEQRTRPWCRASVIDAISWEATPALGRSWQFGSAGCLMRAC